jgi:hypothetical protein
MHFVCLAALGLSEPHTPQIVLVQEGMNYQTNTEMKMKCDEQNIFKI